MSPNGATIMVGGFGLCGIPENLIAPWSARALRISPPSAIMWRGRLWHGPAACAGQIRKHIGTYVGENKLLEQMVLKGEIELDLVPQGTFSERIRGRRSGVFPRSSPQPELAPWWLRRKKLASSTAGHI